MNTKQVLQIAVRFQKLAQSTQPGQPGWVDPVNSMSENKQMQVWINLVHNNIVNGLIGAINRFPSIRNSDFLRHVINISKTPRLQIDGKIGPKTKHMAKMYTDAGQQLNL